MPIKSLIRTIPHYPKPGIQFRDITTLLKDPQGLQLTIDELATRYQGTEIHKVAGIESRGFIVGTPLAYRLGLGFIPLRKQGKLPAATVGQEYQLEYGSDRLEVHVDAISPGERILLVDDLLATGGTGEAAVSLIQSLGGTVAACAFLVELPDLGGRQRLEALGQTVYALCSFGNDEC